MPHETVHNCSYAQPVGELKRNFIKALRKACNKRVPRSKGQDLREKFLTRSASISAHRGLRTVSSLGTGKASSLGAKPMAASWARRLSAKADF